MELIDLRRKPIGTFLDDMKLRDCYWGDCAPVLKDVTVLSKPDLGAHLVCCSNLTVTRLGILLPHLDCAYRSAV